MFPALKKAILPLALFAALFGSASLQPARVAEADIADGVWFLSNYGINGDSCAAGNPADVLVLETDSEGNSEGFVETNMIDDNEGIVQVDAEEDIIMCAEPAEEDSNVTFDTDTTGSWNDAACGNNNNDTVNAIFGERVNDDCINDVGDGSDNLTVVDDGGANDNDLTLIVVSFNCDDGGTTTITISQDTAGGGDSFVFDVMCKGDPNSINLTVLPATIESHPARFNTSHSLIRAIILDGGGGPVLPSTEVEFSVSRCVIDVESVDSLEEREEALDLFGDPPIEDYIELHEFADFQQSLKAQMITFNGLLEIDTNDDDFPDQTEALAIFHAEGCAPGPVTVTVRIDRDEDEDGDDLDDLEATATITVVGPVRFITVTASPTRVICGEKAEIRVSATDELNHGVSDHTQIEVVTNYGGVLAGTGSSLTEAQPVNPLSSTSVDIIDGVGKAFLLTSDSHVGPYEVLAASTLPPLGSGLNERVPPVAQVTVTCTKGVPDTTVTAPNTGTGTSAGAIRPPNTGDAGLLDGPGHGSPWAVVVAAALSSALLAFAGLRLARL